MCSSRGTALTRTLSEPRAFPCAGGTCCGDLAHAPSSGYWRLMISCTPSTSGARTSQVGAQPPYASYAAIIATFGGLLAATAALERARREQRSVTPLELTLLAAASFKAARAISRERVGSVVREPFVEGERPVGSGTRRAFGELVTCTRCLGTWAGPRRHGRRPRHDSAGCSR